MDREFVYRVEGFQPPQEQDRMGGYGFSVYLDNGFAKKAREYKVEDKTQDRFNEIGKDFIIQRLFSKKYIMPPYNFVEDSLLVQFFRVPGDACEISASWDQINSLKSEKLFKNFIEYHPHNVDSVKQAYALFSLFSNWVKYAESLLTPIKP